MNKQYTIRPATLADVDIIFQFISHLEEQSFDIEAFQDRYKANLTTLGIIYLVAVNAEDDAVGFISGHGQEVLHKEGLVYEIQEFYVSRAYRNRGIGKSLFTAVQDSVEKTGKSCLVLIASPGRTDIKRFVGKLGFRDTCLQYVKGL